jgi:DNA-binding XRE family transcriptional regulator
VTRETAVSPKTKKFGDLVAPLMADPERRAEIERGTREILTAVHLVELRRERGFTQAQLAERLGVTQENVSRIERAEDTQLSTIRRYIEALGGNLELHAVFDDRDVPIAPA